MTAAQNFKKALQIMLNNGEFDRIIKNKQTTRRERKNAAHDKKLISGIMMHFDNDITKISFIPVLHDLRSINVLKGAIVIMIGITKDEREVETK